MEVAMEREKLIEAAKLLKENCTKNNDHEICNGCPLLYGGFCMVSDDIPDSWDLSEVQDKAAVQDLMAFKERYKDGR
jgi:hypothetical protein